ncbi:MAG: YraN family protein [Chitinophagaceae bacterium]
MARHQTWGKKGEEGAAAYLLQKGFEILHRNWRHSYYEIDIIALKNGVLHFVELKLRTSKKFGLPEEAVNKRKFRRLLNAADEFLHRHPQYRHLQYDIVAISIHPNGVADYFFIEDAYL